jgi:hypothetical protein
MKYIIQAASRYLLPAAVSLALVVPGLSYAAAPVTPGAKMDHPVTNVMAKKAVMHKGMVKKAAGTKMMKKAPVPPTKTPKKP